MANGFDSFITLPEWFVWVTVGAPQSFMVITTTKGGAIFSHIIVVKSSFEVMRVQVFVILYREADKNYASNLNDKLYPVPKIEDMEYPAYLLGYAYVPTTFIFAPHYFLTLRSYSTCSTLLSTWQSSCPPPVKCQLQIAIALCIAHNTSSSQKTQDAYCIMFLLAFTSGTMYDSFILVRDPCL